MPSKEAKRVQNVGFVGRHFVAQKFENFAKIIPDYNYHRLIPWEKNGFDFLIV